MKNTVEIFGLIFNCLGSLLVVFGLFISKKEAIKLGVSRWSGGSNKERSRLPAVKDRLRQRTYAIIGGICLLVGLFLQILGKFT